MAQVVLKCINNQSGGLDGILDNAIIEDTLVDLSRKFGEFCNSLASKGLFATGYMFRDSNPTYGSTEIGRAHV